MIIETAKSRILVCISKINLKLHAYFIGSNSCTYICVHNFEPRKIVVYVTLVKILDVLDWMSQFCHQITA